MKKVSGVRVATAAVVESPFPAGIQEALGQRVGPAREGLLALSVGVWLSVAQELMEAAVAEVVGPRASTAWIRRPGAIDWTPFIGPPAVKAGGC
jgi:hypothetical protein